MIITRSGSRALQLAVLIACEVRTFPRAVGLVRVSVPPDAHGRADAEWRHAVAAGWLR